MFTLSCTCVGVSPCSFMGSGLHEVRVMTPISNVLVPQLVVMPL